MCNSRKEISWVGYNFFPNMLKCELLYHKNLLTMIETLIYAYLPAYIKLQKALHLLG